MRSSTICPPPNSRELGSSVDRVPVLYDGIAGGNPHGPRWTFDHHQLHLDAKAGEALEQPTQPVPQLLGGMGAQREAVSRQPVPASHDPTANKPAEEHGESILASFRVGRAGAPGRVDPETGAAA